jgi:hypothetical protein
MLYGLGLQFLNEGDLCSEGGYPYSGRSLDDHFLAANYLTVDVDPSRSL